MKWLALLLAGPTLWAAIFAVVYGLHGLVCAGVTGPEGLGQPARLALVVVWGLGLLAYVPLFRILPQGHSLADRLPRLGGWIGVVATAFTLFPVALTTSC